MLKWHFASLSTLQHLGDVDDPCMSKLVADSYGCIKACTPPYTSPCTLTALQHIQSLTACMAMLKWHFASYSTLQHLGDVDDPCMHNILSDAYGCMEGSTPPYTSPCTLTAVCTAAHSQPNCAWHAEMAFCIIEHTAASQPCR